MDIVTLTFLSGLSYTLDVSKTDMKHHWGPPTLIEANFSYKVKSIGLTVWSRTDFGIRVAYGSGERASTKGHYSYIEVDFKHVSSLELMYRYHILPKTYVFAGIGTYLMPTPSYYKGTYKLERMDSDNDEGYFIGIHQELTDNVGISYRYTRYSTIGDSEYTEGYGIHMTYTF
jgi:hypothetical protein